MYQDKTLTCRDCNAEFTWSAGEQEFFAQKGFDRAPTRCPECRKKRRNEKQGAAPASTGPKKLYDITCANCGKQAQVPFEPKATSVLCADCFRAKNPAQQPATAAAPTSATDDASDAAQPAAAATDDAGSSQPDQPAA